LAVNRGGDILEIRGRFKFEGVSNLRRMFRDKLRSIGTKGGAKGELVSLLTLPQFRERDVSFF